MIWDSGSTDATLEIIKTIRSPKISKQKFSSISAETFPGFRQKMINETTNDFSWLMILDADEIWPEKSIKIATDFARNNLDFESIVVRTNNLVGDIYHRLPESAGRYNLAGKTGHLNLRFINLNIPGLHAAGVHGQQGYFDDHNQLIQDRDPQKIKFLDVAYHHASHLQRSNSRASDKQVTKRSPKMKYELGEKISRDTIPSIFFSPRPKIVPDVTRRASLSFWIKSVLLTIPRRVKRKLLPVGHGY